MKLRPGQACVTLTPDLESMVLAEIDAGEFTSIGEVVRDALRERYARKKLAELADAAARGDADIEAGRFMEAGEGFAHIRRELGMSDTSDAK